MPPKESCSGTGRCEQASSPSHFAPEFRDGMPAERSVGCRHGASVSTDGVRDALASYPTARACPRRWTTTTPLRRRLGLRPQCSSTPPKANGPERVTVPLRVRPLSLSQTMR
ncbi:MAG: hypothetical protein QOG59_1006 [Solirubrobacteraceae bacterium]|jgi:hypothetical protein|nr:hypothetical protein [Solirubrobacteraceae bacterium]